MSGHDVVISSVRFEQLNYERLIAAVRRARIKRLLVVGGAGSLDVAPGVPLVESPQFPAQFKPGALAGGKVLDKLRKEEGWGDPTDGRLSTGEKLKCIRTMASLLAREATDVGRSALGILRPIDERLADLAQRRPTTTKPIG